MNFRNLIRLVFVIFSLYLTGDAFYRWDGFKYYASFSEFIPSIALISILWSIIAVLTTIIIWLLLKILGWICRFMKLTVSSEHLLLSTGFLIFLCAIVWTGKKLLWPNINIPLEEKIIVLVSVTLSSAFLTWLLRDKAKSIAETVFERITPLVWLFGIILGLSLPLIALYALMEPPEKSRLNWTAKPLDQPNIILVTYDALTAKDMSVYGYHKQTTPFISEWAKTATVFEKCEAAANATYETVPSLMTGKRVWHHRRFQSDAGKVAKIDIESLPLLLKNSGYYNMAFIANRIASVETLGMSDSFHVNYSPHTTASPVSLFGFLNKYLFEYFGAEIKLYDWILKEDFILHMLLPDDFFKHPRKTEYPVKKIFDMFLNEIDDNYREPFFAWMHLFPPHAPYLPPEQYMGLYDPSPKFRTAKSQYSLINTRHFSKEQQADADIIRSRYDEFILYCDREFEYLIEQVSFRKKLKNTVIILSSDHGEGFEHGFFTHGNPKALYEEMTHIPLIIKEPVQNEGRSIDIPVEMTDIPATILDLAHISVPAWMDGRSLVPFLHGEELEPRPVFSMTLEEVPSRGLEEINKGVVAVWDGDYKLIHNIASKETLLFNLKLDPNEINNLFPNNVEIGKHLFSLIQDNIDKANESLIGQK